MNAVTKLLEDARQRHEVTPAWSAANHFQRKRPAMTDLARTVVSAVIGYGSTWLLGGERIDSFVIYLLAYLLSIHLSPPAPEDSERRRYWHGSK